MSMPMSAGVGGGGPAHHSRTPSGGGGGGEYGYRGPGESFDVSGVGGSDAERLNSARAEAEAADRSLWEKERASSQAKVNTANLTQKLQELVLFRRRCEASLSEVSGVIRSPHSENPHTPPSQLLKPSLVCSVSVSYHLSTSIDRMCDCEV